MTNQCHTGAAAVAVIQWNVTNSVVYGDDDNIGAWRTNKQILSKFYVYTSISNCLLKQTLCFMFAVAGIFFASTIKKTIRCDAM